MRSVVVAKLKTRINQTSTVFEYKIDTGSGVNLVSIKMFKTLFLNTEVTELNKSVDKRIVLHVYNNSCIPEMAICKGFIIHKGLMSQCNFSVVQGNGPGMPD